MSGALSTFARTRRRRFEEGGSASRGYEDYPPSAEDDPNTSAGVPRPAVSGDAPLDTDPNRTGGALADAAPPSVPTTLARHGDANNNFATMIMNNAGIHTPSYLDPSIIDPAQREGATNLPMLAAAGAMLQPTHSGGFAEALGRAFSAAVPVAEQDRATYENALLRKAQMDQTALYQQGMLGVRNKTADASTMRAAAYKAFSEEKARLMQGGLDEKTADHQAHLAQDAGKLDVLAQHYADMAANYQRTGDQRDVSNDLRGQSLQLGRERIALDRERLAQSAEFKNLQMQMQTLFHNDSRARLAAGQVLQYAASTGSSIERAKQYVAQQFPELLGAKPLEAPQGTVPPAGGGGGGGGGGGTTKPTMSKEENDAGRAQVAAALAAVKGTAGEQAARAKILARATASGVTVDGL